MNGLCIAANGGIGEVNFSYCFMYKSLNVNSLFRQYLLDDAKFRLTYKYL